MTSTHELLGSLDSREGHQVGKPTLLNPQREGDARIIRELRADPRVWVFDTLPLQLSDLMATRHPRQTLSAEKTHQLIDEHLEGVSLEAYGVWVYYSWSGRLVHLLPEAEFVELRTDRNKYKITPDEQRRLASWRVGVVGLSVGQSVALSLALERGCGELRIADFDELELSNLNRIRTGIHNLGLSKAAMTAREIAELDPFLSVTCFPEGVTEENVEAFFLEGGKLDLVIEECDSPDIKILVREKARSHQIPVLMVTSDRWLVDSERFDLEPDRPLFHGLAPDVSVEEMRGLTMEEKLPFVLGILGINTISPRHAASLMEIEQSVKGVSQLGSEVLGEAALAASLSRRMALHGDVPSGRYFADPEAIIMGSDVPLSPQNEPNAESRITLAPDWADSLSRQCGEVLSVREGALVLTRETVKLLVEAAVTAPSGGNAQPWLWVYRAPWLVLALDRTRSTPILDFEYLGSLVGLGAATENLTLAAHHEGFCVRIHPFPAPNLPEVVAAFEFHQTPDASSEVKTENGLYEAMARRHTNRNVGPRRPIPQADLDAIRRAVQSIPGADIQICTLPEELTEVGALLGTADRLRIFNPTMRQGLFAETWLTQEDAQEHGDGLSIHELGMRAQDVVGFDFCRNRPDALALLEQWGVGGALETMSQRWLAGAGAVALVTMPSTRQIDYVNGGRAIERAWLTATTRKMGFQPMTVLPYFFARLLRKDGEGFSAGMVEELRVLRLRYQKVFPVSDAMAEVMLFRLAMVEEPTHRSFRRPLDAVLHIIEDT